MKRGLRFYPMYVNEFDEDPNVLTMDLSEVGLYLLALNESWKRGGIPKCPGELARLIRRRESAVKKAWQGISRCWIPSEAYPGMLVNPRQEIERKKAQEKSDKARSSVISRYSGADTDVGSEVSTSVSTNVDTETHTKRVLRASNSISYSYSEVKPTNAEKASPCARGPAEWFPEFWAVYWRKIAKAEAFKCYKRHVLTEAMHADILAAVAAQTPVMLARDPSLRPHASTWLNQRRWEDEPEPVPLKQSNGFDEVREYFKA